MKGSPFLIEEKETNRFHVTFAKPDLFEEFKTTLLDELQKYPFLASLSEESVLKLLDRAHKKSLLTIKLDKKTNSENPFSIQKDTAENVVLTIHQADQYGIFKAELLNKLRENPNLITLSQVKLDELVQNSKQRSFFGLYLVLLFISSLIILKIQKHYIQSDKTKQVVYNLISFIAIVLIIWLIPGLNLFSRIVSSIIYFTVLSLYTIETDDESRFKDNFRFLLMIFIYSGFWILYFQMFDSVLWYVKAYVDASSLNNFINSIIGTIGIRWSFNVEAVTYINAGTIILLQLIVSNIVKNTKALPTMVAGIAMGTIGMAILAISTNIWVFVAGIFIFSIGEMTAHPKFYSYVGLTAPKDRVATYMGYIFLYGVIGSSIGAILGANMYVHFVDKLNQPRTLWLIFSGIGIATIVGLVLYNKFTPKVGENKK
jgi:dipeptide/tripeptide permease